MARHHIPPGFRRAATYQRLRSIRGGCAERFYHPVPIGWHRVCRRSVLCHGRDAFPTSVAPWPSRDMPGLRFGSLDDLMYIGPGVHSGVLDTPEGGHTIWTDFVDGGHRVDTDHFDPYFSRSFWCPLFLGALFDGGHLAFFEVSTPAFRSMFKTWLLLSPTSAPMSRMLKSSL